MFPPVEPGEAVPKSEFKAREHALWSGLLERQRALRAAGVSTLVVLAGPEGGGKGEVADRLNRWLDARGVETHAFWAGSDEERERPRMWRYWRRLPPRGTIAIMFGAWYWWPLYRRVRGEIDAAAFEREARRVAALERMLVADGMLIVKLWLHLDREAHRKRLSKRREVQRHVRGLAAEGDGDGQFETFLKAAGRIVALTEDACPWYLVDAGEPRHRDLSAGEILLDAMGERLSSESPARGRGTPAAAAPSTTAGGTGSPSALDRADLTVALDKPTYDDELKRCRKRLADLAWRAHDARVPAVVVFEGWDAAGKGGIIQRMAAAIDTRLFQVVPVGPPNDVERTRHYLWRFWRRLPRAGFMTIYDRSWYGRVLIERVEGLADPDAWGRAYDEINDFERQLVEHGVVLAKYWLHISADEQLRRFREREQTPWKRHKITADDWRNRERRADYLEAVEVMIERTDTPEAPWTLIAAEDKRHARIAVLRSYCERLEGALEG